MYEGNERVRQVEAIKRMAANIAESFALDPEDCGGIEESAQTAVDYYLDECPNTINLQWFDDHDRGLLVRFVEEALQ